MNIFHSMVEQNNISLQYHAHTWKDAIKEGCRILEDKQFITQEFYDEVVRHTEEYGAYYIVAPKVAVSHAHDEKHIIANGISLVVLVDDVLFPLKDEKVDMIFTLALKQDCSETDKIVEQLIAVLENEIFLRSIRISTTHNTLSDLFKKKLFKTI